MILFHSTRGRGPGDTDFRSSGECDVTAGIASRSRRQSLRHIANRKTRHSCLVSECDLTILESGHNLQNWGHNRLYNYKSVCAKILMLPLSEQCEIFESLPTLYRFAAPRWNGLHFRYITPLAS